jgi:hypothetical protein
MLPRKIFLASIRGYDQAARQTQCFITNREVNMPHKPHSGGSLVVAALLFALLSISVPGMAKAYNDFKKDPAFTVSYPDDWFRPDPTSSQFHVVPVAEKDSGDPVNIQVRCYELTKADAALPYAEFTVLQTRRHIQYLEDNLNFEYDISSVDSLGVDGADIGFHFSTTLEDAMLVTDYARKGNMMYIFRFFCPIASWEKYLTDYYVMRGSFILK